MISVVMTVHNEDKYFIDALKSLENQTYTNYELIIIDDGSTNENTKKILFDLTGKKEVKIISSARNNGAPVSRNIGLMVASGDYVVFLDADDIFHENYLEDMYQKAVSENLDLVVCGYRDFEYDDTSKISSIYIPSEFNDNNIDVYLDYRTNAWSKMIRRKFLIENSILFQSIKAVNDAYFSLASIALAKKVGVVDKILVDYRIGNSQITPKRSCMDICMVAEMCFNELYPKLSVEKKKQLLVRILAFFIQDMSAMPEEEAFTKMKRLLLKHAKTISLDTSIMAPIKELVEHQQYDKNLFEKNNRFYYLMKRNWKNIYKNLEGKNYIYLWGAGNRGLAFIRLCQENNISIKGIYDQNKKFEDLICMVSKEEMLTRADLIVAANSAVHEQMQKEQISIQSICLMDFEE